MRAAQILCRIGLHSWAVRRPRGIAPYVACRRCDKEQMLDLRPERFMGSTEGRMFGESGR